MRAFLLRLAAFGWLLLLPAGGHAAPRKEAETLPKPPPQPVPQKISVPRGGKVEIVLRVYERPVGTVQYLIRQAPDSGKLSAPKRLAQDTATVTYEPPEDITVKADRFSYAAQNALGVSAPADVSITIVDEPARLIVPVELSFEAILAGTSSRQEFSIKNDGGSMAEGEVQVDRPWQVEGDHSYRLGRGEQKKFGLIYAPAAGGTWRGEVRYTSHRDRVTTLTADAKYPLSLTPPRLQLSREANETARSGATEIANLTSEPQTVKILAGPRWKVVASVELPPNGSAPLLIRLAPEDTALARETLKLQGAGIELALPIEAPEVPAVLRAEASLVQLRAMPGRPAIAQASVRNAGGHQGFWKVEADAPFLVDQQDLQLGAGQVGAVTVRLEASTSGRTNGTVRFVGEQQTVTVPVEAEIAAGVAAPLRASMPSNPTGSSSQPTVKPADDPAPERATGLRGFGLPVPVVTTTTAVLEWPAQLTEGQPLRAERRQLSVDQKHKMQVTWVEMPTAHFSTANGKAHAVLEHLAPGTVNVVRISAAPAGTQAWRTLFQMPIMTSATERSGRTWWLWAGLLVVACGGWWWQRSRRLGSEE